MNPVEGLDAYELRHLVGHLIGSARQKDVQRLLALETTDGGNVASFVPAARWVRDIAVGKYSDLPMNGWGDLPVLWR